MRVSEFVRERERMLFQSILWIPSFVGAAVLSVHPTQPPCVGVCGCVCRCFSYMLSRKYFILPVK